MQNNVRASSGEPVVPAASQACRRDLTDNQVEPAAKKARRSRLTFKEEWKLKYLMWPVANSSELSSDSDEEMVCIQCMDTMKAKSSTADRHVGRKHPRTSTIIQEQRLRLLRQFERSLKHQQSAMSAALLPDELVKLAPYKLAFVIGKRKLPFQICDALWEFASSADPQSAVFSRMPHSRDTVTRRT